MEGKVILNGDASSLRTEMQKAADAVRGFQSQAEGSFGKVQSSIGAMQAKWVALGSLILGGAGFKEAVDASVNLTKESVSLGKALGINATQASILNVALGDIYQSKDALIAASSKMTQTLKKDEEAFTDLGVKTRDQNGHFRNTLDIMLDVNARLLQFKEGTDRNIEGMKIYGKQWGEVSGLLKLNAELLEESKAKAEALNLVVGEESIKATSKYRASMNDVEDVLTAVKKTVGDGVMPVLTDLGNEFSQVGPQKVEFMRKAVGVLVAAFYGLKNGVELAWIGIKTPIQALTVELLTFADVGSKALRLDFAGAKEAWKNGVAQYKDIWINAGKDVVAVSEKNGAAINRALQRGFGPVNVTEAKGAADGTAADTSSGGKKDPEKTRTAEWDNILDRQKQAHTDLNALNGTFYEFSKQREADYWKSVLAQQDLSQKERYEVERKHTRLVLDNQKEQYDARIAGLKLELESFQNNMDQRTRIATQIAEQTKQRYGQDSKEYAKSQEELVKIQRKRVDQQRTIENELREVAIARQNAFVEAERAQAELQESQGLITREQLLAMDADFEARAYDIKRMALSDKLALLVNDPDYDPATRAQLQRQIEELEIQHQQRMGQIKNAQTLESGQPQSNVFGSMESSWEAATTSILTKQRSFMQAMSVSFKGIGAAFIQEMVSKPIAQWMAMWARKLAMNMGFLTAENAQQAASSVAGTGIAVADATTKIGANAAVAGSGAAASQASIPYIGPILAVAAMAAIFGAVMGMKSSVKSAAGGFDIPKGMNPMTQLHEEEMVLPGKYANGLRDMINGGGGAGPREGDTHLHLHTPDAASARRFLMDNKSALADALKSAYRNGKR
jgi:hypothetical protein